MTLDPQLIQQIAGLGTGGDTELAHVTRGDITVPAEAPQQVKDAVHKMLAAHGYDPMRYTAGSGANEMNPNTGIQAFEDGGNGGDGSGSDGGGNGAASGGTSEGVDGGGGPSGMGGGEKGGTEHAPGDNSQQYAPTQQVLNNQTFTNPNAQPAPPTSATPGPTGPNVAPPNIQPSISALDAALTHVHGLDKSPTFSPGYGSDIISQILGQQHNTAEQQLQNAHARGTLSDQGFNTAETQLGNQDLTARSKATNTADSLLASYQQQLDQLNQRQLTTAGQTTDTNPYDATANDQTWNNLISHLTGGFQGDLLNGLPPGGLYDPTALIAAGGNSQGLYNPGGNTSGGGPNPIITALANQRGLGSTGAF